MKSSAVCTGAAHKVANLATAQDPLQRAPWFRRMSTLTLDDGGRPVALLLHGECSVLVTQSGGPVGAICISIRPMVDVF
jgi:hypothetical protein